MNTFISIRSSCLIAHFRARATHPGNAVAAEAAKAPRTTKLYDRTTDQVSLDEWIPPGRHG